MEENKIIDKRESKRNNKKNLYKGLLMILIYFFILFYSNQILASIGIDIYNLSDKKRYLISMVMDLLTITILIGIDYKKIHEEIKCYFKNFKTYIKSDLKYWLIALAVMLISNFLISLIFSQSSSANDAMIKKMFNKYPFYIIISTIITAPIMEELIYRKSLKYMIRNKYVFMIVSGLFFGFMHIVGNMSTIADILYIIPYSVPGIMFAYMLTKEDNIFVPITFHMIHNIISAILVLFLNIF